MSYLFTVLDIPTILRLFECITLEKKIVMFSQSYSALTPIWECLRSLLFPFEWPYVYIPVLPTSLGHVLSAPMPFLLGLHRTFLDEIIVADDVGIVDVLLSFYRSLGLILIAAPFISRIRQKISQNCFQKVLVMG